MDWTQVLVIVFSNLGIFVPMVLWMRSEAGSETRHMDQKLDNLIHAIQEETREFHGRLCSLEAKTNGK